MAKRYGAVLVGVTFWCPNLERDVTVDSAYIVGGCSGHFGEFDYCYCDSPSLEVTCECTTPKGKQKLTHNLSVY